MKKIASILLLIFINVPSLLAYEEIYWPLKDIEKEILTFWGDNSCKDVDESDIPTIFVPWILASWYSEEWFNDNKVKRWIPDPITNSYDTLFYTFKQNWYELKDVFYKSEFETYIDWNPKKWLYLFWYDWKKDSKITAKLLRDLILQIRLKYEEENWCDIETVNIISHSMWWLVARAMLEDMCASDESIKNYYKNNKLWQIKEIESSFCYNYTRINNFITIGTPQRWSPKSLALWEKWDIDTVENFFVWTPLKLQLWNISNEWLYKTLHWYKEKVPNGIITIGQLLPDIKNNNIYNNSLKYLYKNYPKGKSNNDYIVENNKKYYLNNNVYPQNSFLEELNMEENIWKMFNNISWKYTLYYSNKTWNIAKNNILEYDINDEYTTLYNWYKYKTVKTDIDNTYDIWKNDVNDIYSKYDSYKIRKEQNFYNYLKIIRNENWLWWDWTVPSKNSRLVANDLYNASEVEKSNKFESVEVSCYNSLWEENELSKNLWSSEWWLCAHSNLPIISAIKVYEEISWNKITLNSKWNYSNIKEINLLYSYIGHIDYKDIKISKVKVFKPSLDWFIKEENRFKEVWIFNNTNINILFDKFYKSLFKSKEEIYNFLNNRVYDDYERKEIEFAWKIGSIKSLLRYEILSPINLIIEDELWRKIWINPETWMIINEIPGAWTSWNTDWSNEPEFFLIPKIWTWEILHKINTYWTGDWEYNIIMDDIKLNIDSKWENEYVKDRLIIEWIAEKWKQENYMVFIKWTKAWYKKLDENISNNIKNINLDKKYWNLWKKIKFLLDTNKYNNKQKEKLKNKLIILQSKGYWKFWNDEKIVYLVGKVVEYLR